MQYWHFLLILTGALTGVLGGMLGIGGSIIMLPAMVWLVPNEGGHNQIHQYMGAAMIVNFLLSIPSVAAHAKKKAIWPGLVKMLMLGGLVGVVFGVAASSLFYGENARYISYFLGVLFIYVGIDNVIKVIRQPKTEGLTQQQVEAEPWYAKFGIGVGVGTLAGFTGLGGGVMAVPAQQYILKMPMRFAIANSSALIVSIAWLGAITKNASLVMTGQGTLSKSLLLTLCLAPTAMIGSYIGGHITHSMAPRWIRLAFAAMIIASTYKMFAGK
jgi:uncharacterized membrane protein YfcA